MPHGAAARSTDCPRTRFPAEPARCHPLAPARLPGVLSLTLALGNINATVQILLNSRWWLQVRGGGGMAGYGYGEAAVRHLVRGNDDRGSLFVSGTVGGAGVATRDGFYAGPSVGANLEWRP